MAELVEVAKAGNMSRVRDCVLKSGCDVNFRCPPDGSTALYWAACSGHLLVCDWLISHGADIGLATTKSGSTALHGATDRGHYECVDLLLKRGSRVDQQTTTNGDTALHLAAYRGHLDVCRLLIENGAKTWLINKQGRTALDESKIKDHEEVCKLLFRHNSNLQNQGLRKGKNLTFYSKSLTFDCPDTNPAEKYPSEFEDENTADTKDHTKDHRNFSTSAALRTSFTPVSRESQSPSSCYDSYDDRVQLPVSCNSPKDEQLKSLQSKISGLESYVEVLETKISVRDRTLEQLRLENASLRVQLESTKLSTATQEEVLAMRRQMELSTARAESALRELENTRRRYQQLESVVYGVSQELKDFGHREEAT